MEDPGSLQFKVKEKERKKSFWICDFSTSFSTNSLG